MYSGTLFLFLGDLGGGELFVILTAVLLLFGADKIPGIARSFGRGIREFKDATNEIKNELERHIDDDNKPKTV
ncbi:twin-arginine translocase TatA/TatE family subunit [Pontibacter qinzhouensis]|uniref:Sec-independent protein translocase protein TatA n=1 Tax=Pontibacter qinzhouensis TaxID=2603253 RepID=A0A5C8K5N8_9BACT|nr:twin-arginine translocase TatA/TatE family subunit [Pontibacter qinzhouensis]TXK46040.1 twin-arginine translocase TatA/TatE family subunit [Pontibacter qinzhouensis]